MSEHVWVSTAPGSVAAEFGFHWPTAQYDLPQSIEASDALMLDSEKGVPLPSDRFPSVLETKRTPTKGDPHKWKLPKKLPHYVKWICPVVSKDIADVIRQFDIGESNFYPVEMRRADEDKPYEQEFFIINVEVAKDTIVPDQSPAAQERGPKAKPYYRLRAFEDDQISVKSGVLGSPDIWVDPIVNGGEFFVSDKLHSALIATKLAEPLQFMRCSVFG
ncbi:imm11 family protein [Litoreibacter roseus]|uniref:Immunity MXAN-0049 protein domain-containing protein n=1 Tax=Litoreibacter roseus TaxID=2601869 RepID=A0A6N6JFD0_9RHOB|nr:DUF1629 domain-containing protein [Litoreibacter roseus]GFE63998.1 hypothetical protein KIN_10720 [Litoreibacter roseus]